jgi:hypothetical protein
MRNHHECHSGGGGGGTVSVLCGARWACQSRSACGSWSRVAATPGYRRPHCCLPLTRGRSGRVVTRARAPCAPSRRTGSCGSAQPVGSRAETHSGDSSVRTDQPRDSGRLKLTPERMRCCAGSTRYWDVSFVVHLFSGGHRSKNTSGQQENKKTRQAALSPVSKRAPRV